MKLLAFDPGKNTGWARFRIDQGTITLERFGTVTGDEALLAFLKSEGLTDYLVYEDYIIRTSKRQGGFDHTWNRGDTLRIIGMLKTWADLQGCSLTKGQQSNIKAITARWFGFTYKKKKDQHHLDAILHGVHFVNKQFGLMLKDFNWQALSSN